MHVQPPGSVEPHVVGGCRRSHRPRRRRGSTVSGEADVSAGMPEPSAADPRLRADPLADDTIARILGETAGTPLLPRWEAVALVEDALASWTTNAALDGWTAAAGTPLPIAAALEHYVRQARQLPAWADPGKIGCAEAVFAEIGLTSPTLLACAVLPEADVAVDPLAQPLDERVRAAIALQCAVLLPGGLLDPAGAGLAQLLKTRLTNALIRHLIVRGNPAEALAHGAAIHPLRPEGPQRYRVLFAHGWNVRANGLPRNQQEQAYALLTCHYVFLRSLRRLGLGLPRQEESAWLHAWNVAGHLLGIEDALLAATMKDAATQFARLQHKAQASAAARYAAPARKGAAPAYGKIADPRPALAASLMHALQDEIGARSRKPFPILLARRLCGPATGRILGLDGRVSLRSRALFALAMMAARVVPGPSIGRLAGRILGYRLAQRYMLDPARPLDLPDVLLRQVDAAVRGWDSDALAPRWVRALERRFRPRHAKGSMPAAAAC